MKKSLFSILALFLVMLMLFVSCTTTPVDNNTTDGTTDTQPPTTETESESESETNETETDPPIIDNTPVTVTETYLAPELYSRIKTAFESKADSYSCYEAGSSPFAIRDVYTISNATLKSISIPVYKTGKMNEDGDFRLSIFTVKNSFDGLKESYIEQYIIKINAEKYNLQENSNIFRFITVDLTDYNIVLDEETTVAFFNGKDTIYPAFIKPSANHSVYNMIQSQTGVTGFFSKVGTENLGCSTSVLFYDFTFERTYENQAAYDAIAKAEADYQAKLAAVKAAWEGKKLSIMGDSISTFGGISNNTSINSTIGNNEVYYPTSNPNFTDSKYTYWGRLLNDVNMDLCVNNAWSGSHVYGGRVADKSDNILERADRLARNDGTSPDLILVYMGINDLHNGSPAGDLYSILTDQSDTRSTNEKVDAWFTALLAKAGDLSKVTPGTTYKGWEEAYALAIYQMMQSYSAADIYCFTLIDNHHSKMTEAKLTQYNTCIRAIVEYFDVGLIDQQAGAITPENCHNYGGDATSLHPNLKGHELMTRLIVETLYNDLNQ